jgi:hypothetical protein
LGGSVATGGTSGSSTTNPDSDAAANSPSAASHVWAEWPMPNPAAAGLPNPQKYDTGSFQGVVIDLVTGLQWQASVEEGSHVWHDAEPYCAALTLSGGGWRLPSRIELMSIVDFTAANPLIDVIAFPGTPADYYWTSSKLADDDNSAWNINFGFSDGMADKGEITKMRRVRCVR